MSDMTNELDYYEAAVLSLTMRADYAAQVFDQVKPSDFSSQLQDYAEASYELLQEGKPVDAVTVAEKLDAHGIANAGQMLGLIGETAGHTSIEHLDAYCEILSSRGLRRSLRAALASAQRIIEDEPDAHAAHEKILAQLDLVAPDSSDDHLWDMSKASIAFLQEMDVRNSAGGELIGLSTGYPHLDDRINGMREGDLIIVAGRPSMGKSTFAMNIVEHNAVRQKKPSLVFSMEMSVTQLIEKMTASAGGIDLTSLRRGTLSEEEWTRFSAASQMIRDANLFIDDRGGLSVAQMRARAHMVKRVAGGLDLIMVDYLQLMSGKGENRTQEITKISGGLKSMAKEFQCPVIALSQLSRAVESRADKRPMMSDLRESGAIEQDADIIIFPFREGYYVNPDNPDPLTEIIFGKIRMGERGSEGLEFQGKFSRFKALDHRVDFEARRMQREQAEAESRKRERRPSRGGMEI
ncbi:replicative DNA helicase [Marinobacter sp.]|uniref:replicative DNA helicase n=1 Tax=Marinobacter sp. TaxID=50741 RepID=UPI003561559B